MFKVQRMESVKDQIWHAWLAEPFHRNPKIFVEFRFEHTKRKCSRINQGSRWSGVNTIRGTDQQVTSAACFHLSAWMVAGIEGFILDGGELSLACTLIQTAESPGRGTESRSGFSWTPMHSFPSLSFLPPLSWSVSVLETDMIAWIIREEPHHRDAITEFGLA